MKSKQLKNNWQDTLKKERLTLIVAKDGHPVFKGKSNGVNDLLVCSQKRKLRNTEIYDTKIGLASAKIAVWSKAKFLFGLIATEAAIEFCQKNKVPIEFEKKVKRLYAANEKGCLLEKIALKSKNLKELIRDLKTAGEVKIEKCPKNGVFPLNYYSTSNRPTTIHFKGKAIAVKNCEMDKGIFVDKSKKMASCVSSSEIKRGDWIAIGELGEGIFEKEINHQDHHSFGFMKSETSGERPKNALISQAVAALKSSKAKSGRILFVVGPAVIHTGAGKHLASLIRKGYIDVIFGGNAIAAHDLEENYLGTSLGIRIADGIYAKNGHHNHLRTINAVRYYGNIKNFIEKGLVKKGIFYEAVKKKVKYILAGSIRDDGPLPDVITDSLQAQTAMRREVRKGFGVVVMIATSLHSIATGNLLANYVQKIIVDDNLATVTKLVDRGTDAVGVVTDCAYFLKEIDNKL